MISVIIPAYQCQDLLRSTVEAVLAAGLPLNEILIIDDGSKDGTAALCDRLEAEKPLVRCIHKENGGVSSARNLGIAEANGDYIWFVDSDDAVLPIPTAELATCASTGADMILFGAEYEYYRGNKVLRREKLCIQERLTLADSQIGVHFRELFYQNYLSAVWNKLIRRSLLTENEISFHPALNNYEDLEFTLRALAVSKTIVALPEAYYRYKGDYDHDRTIDRIGRIENVAENTDHIASAFFALSERCSFDHKADDAMRSIVLNIYLDLFRVKMQTTPPWKIRKQCEDYCADAFISRCADRFPELSAGSQQLCRNIQAKRVLSIWGDSRKRMLRYRAARIIKPILKRETT